MNDAPNPMDPHGWLTKIPELERFAGDPEISRALAAGEPRKLHASLEARRRKPRTPMEVQALDRILANRRAFAMPVMKAPSLFTLNGIGQRIYGKSDARPDGTFIGTLYATVIYVPLYPIAQYVLARDGKRYGFVGELPPSRGMVRWRRAAAAVAVAGIAAIVASAWWSGRYAQVQLVNGLDIPVTVTAAAEKVELAPGARATRRLEVGRTTFRATTRDGKTLEEVTERVPRGTDLVAYNVLGAAPLAVEPIVYSSAKGKAPEPAVAMYGGRSFVTRDGVQYLFRDPPAQLKMSAGQKHVIHWHALLADGGWRTTAMMLTFQKQLDQYAALAERIALAQPDDPAAAYNAVRTTRLLRGPAAGLEVARRIASALPEAMEPQRVLVSTLLATGRREEARKVARQRLEKAPDSMLAGYLSARVEPLAVGTASLRELAKRFPDAAQIHASLAWRHLAAGSAPAALEELDRHDRLKPDEHRRMLELRTEALVLAGRPVDAARSVLEEAGKDPTLSEALLYAQVAQLAGAGAPQKPMALLERLAGDDAANRGAVEARACLTLGTPPPDEKALAAVPGEITQAIARIEAAAATDPAAALKRVAAAHANVVGALDEGLALLLAGEAARTGASPLATRLLEAAFLDVPPAELLSYVAGGSETPQIASLSRTERAVLRYGRSRTAASATAARAEEAAAKSLDPLHGLVWQAARRWPAARR